MKYMSGPGHAFKKTEKAHNVVRDPFAAAYSKLGSGSREDEAGALPPPRPTNLENVSYPESPGTGGVDANGNFNDAAHNLMLGHAAQKPDSYMPQPAKAPSDIVHPDTAGLIERAPSAASALGPVPRPDLDAAGIIKNKNGALKSGVKKGWDAFLSSGNPLAFAFGFGSGATVDKNYDERKRYREALGTWDTQYQRASEVDKAAMLRAREISEAQARDRGANIQVRGQNQTQAQHDVANKQAAQTHAAALVKQAIETQGGNWLPGQREQVEAAAGKSYPTALEAKRDLDRIVTEQEGRNVYASVNKNNPSEPARILTGPNGEPLTGPKGQPLVEFQVGREAHASGLREAEGLYPYKTPAQINKEASDAADEETAALFGHKPTAPERSVSQWQTVFKRKQEEIYGTNKQEVDAKRNKHAYGAEQKTMKRPPLGSSQASPKGKGLDALRKATQARRIQ